MQSNILVSASDEGPIVKVIDFGVAKAMKDPLTDVTLSTGQGQLLGTPTYMSPEQASITETDIDSRSDIFSLGVVLYEMLVGELPVDWFALGRESFYEIMRKIREEDPPTPSARFGELNQGRSAWLASQRGVDSSTLYARNLRGDLDKITMMAIAKERLRRYKSAADLADDIERYLNGEPVRAVGPSTIYRLAKLSQRHRHSVAIITVLVIALFAAIAWGYANRFYYNYARDDARIAEIELTVAKSNLNRERQRHEYVYELLGTIRAIERLEGETDSIVERGARDPKVIDDWLNAVRELTQARQGHEIALAKLESTGETFSTERAKERLVQGLGEVSGAEATQRLEREITRRRVELEIESKVRSVSFETRDLELRHELLCRVALRGRRLEGLAGELTAWAESNRARPQSSTIDSWRELNARLKDSKVYDSLAVTRQRGLKPLGTDPDGKLEAFLVAGTGTAPTRGDSGKFTFDASTGIVLLLVPAHEDVGPAYFASKFEVSEAQWARMNGTESASASAIENVSAAQAEAIIARLGLHLPWPQEWILAAATDVTFPSNDSSNDDRKDAAVYERAKNAWGFGGVSSGVSELTRGPSEQALLVPALSGEFLVIAAKREVRGGSYRTPVLDRAANYRFETPAFIASEGIGLRVARPLDD
ncbi:MAG: protein kinase [Planctomycetota bacterium]